MRNPKRRDCAVAELMSILKTQINENKINVPNPVVNTSKYWPVVSEQIETILGHTIYSQWFAKVRPIVVSNNVLLLKAENAVSAYWLNTNYKELVNTLLQTRNKKISCFFVHY